MGIHMGAAPYEIETGWIRKEAFRLGTRLLVKEDFLPVIFYTIYSSV
jgi:hypothetical protein